MDYQLDTATIIGALVSGYDNHWTMTLIMVQLYGKTMLPDTTITTIEHGNKSLAKCNDKPEFPTHI